MKSTSYLEAIPAEVAKRYIGGWYSGIWKMELEKDKFFQKNLSIIYESR